MRTPRAVARNSEHACGISSRPRSKLDGDFALSVVQQRHIERVQGKGAGTRARVYTHRTAGRVPNDQYLRLDLADWHPAEIDSRVAECELARGWWGRRRRTSGDRVGVPDDLTVGKSSFGDDEVDAIFSRGGLL